MWGAQLDWLEACPTTEANAISRHYDATIRPYTANGALTVL
jgi:hypothetical protein